MSYTKQLFKSGDVLKASQLNAMDAQIYANEVALAEKQPKGDYPTTSEVEKKILQAKPDLSAYLTKSLAESTYQPKGNYLTKHQDISNLATKDEIPSLTGYATEQWVTSQNYLTTHQDISNLATKDEIPSLKDYVKTEDLVPITTSTTQLSNKVTALEKAGFITEHQTLKTLNGTSLVGEGNVEINPTKEIKEYNQQVGFVTLPDEQIAFGLRDSNGYYAFQIDNDGIIRVGTLYVNNLHTSKEETNSSSWLKGKKCFVLGDSLSADTKSTGSWHQKFCELSGAVLDANLNRNWFSVGGTATIGTHTEKDACAQMRAKRLVEYYKEGNDVDIIFLQNVNDINNNRYSAGINGKGSSEDLPFFENQVITYNKDIIAVSTASTEVIAYFKEHLSEILEGVTPMVGTVVDMLYTTGTSGAKEMTINTTPTADGNITLTFKKASNYRNEVYNIAVKAGMSKEEVVNAILEWQYQDVGYYDDVAGENGDSVIFSSPYSLEFDGGNTGIEVTITDTGTINRYPIAFKSLNVEDFTNVDSWGYESSVTYWSAQKGLMEYLQKNIPTAKIFYLILPYYKVTYPASGDYLRADGSFNMEKWVSSNNSSVASKLYAEQPLVAKYYGCPCIDVVSNCSINGVNIESFYPSNDVHPKTAGYNVWGETIYRLIN